MTPDAKKLLANPFYIADQPGLTESSGWLDAWRSSPSAYVVAAESAADVVAAVRFARAHNLRLVVKGRGHSYLGASNAPDSLLVWTRHMDGVTVHDAFTPGGLQGGAGPGRLRGRRRHVAARLPGGDRRGGRYVQGGGCTTVGVAGLVQGGGFGSFSKGFGTAGASLLEAEIVTADGKVRIVNAVQEPDLFWALKGGGGGTFGVVTRLTLATHELPETFGAVNLTLHARSDEAYRRLLARFVDLYANSLFNPHWGEQASAGPDNRLSISMVFQGLKPDAGEGRLEAPDRLRDRQRHRLRRPELLQSPSRCRPGCSGTPMSCATCRASSRPTRAQAPRRPTSGGRAIPARSASSGTATHRSGCPGSLLEPGEPGPARRRLVRRQPPLVGVLPLQQGPGRRAPEAAIAAARDTATNPDVLGAFALAIIAMDGASLFTGATPDLAAARANAARIQAAMTALRKAAPDAGAYVNECDYFQEDWQKAFWGPNYPRLARIKRRYDPGGLFTVHHGVGSEAWSPDGFTRVI